MSKIIPFKSRKDNVYQFIEEFKEEIEKENIENLVIACKLNNGEILAGHTRNLDYGDLQVIISHLQTMLYLKMNGKLRY